ncbi:MAG: heme-binding domain-containing protein [Armatimonadetes bacterium]|nr:heme-binding domain-containing protein [Armatimonadota bacterium]
MNNQSSSEIKPIDSTSSPTPKKRPRRKWWIIAGGVVAALVVLQFFGPTLQNPPVDPLLADEGNLHLPTDARHVLRTACMDCHSHTTDWPWFAHIAPISWFVVHNVDEGREHLNFSRWGSYTPKQQSKLIDEISTVIRYERMPPSLHTLTHPSARLSTNERFVLYFWARNQLARLRGQE